VRLQKLLAQAGFGSRREIEQWIESGRITINGTPAPLGNRARASDRIFLDGQLLTLRSVHSERRVLLYHKPEGELVSRHDPEGRPTVFARLPRLTQGKWQSVGRLDMNTSGVLLFTNDGELTHRLTHPSFGLEREYAVRVLGGLSDEEMDQLRQGVTLDDGLASFDLIQEAGGEGANRWYHVTLREGRNREVRRLIEAVGKRVSRLIRVRYGTIRLPARLRAGHWQELAEVELDALLASGHVERAR